MTEGKKVVLFLERACSISLQDWQREIIVRHFDKKPPVAQSASDLARFIYNGRAPMPEPEFLPLSLIEEKETKN